MAYRFVLVGLLALATANPASSLPLPPPPPQEMAQQKQFFEALPKRLPPTDLKAFAPYVSPDVKVYRDGKLAFNGRETWFAFLRSFAANASDKPQGLSVSREAFYRTRDGAFVVLEFLWPIAPKGKEGQISYHSSHDFTLTTYHLDDGRLVRVDYGPPMRKYDWLLECPPGDEPRSTDFCRLGRP